ncbi:MAG: YfcE family phosphodiesterase [Bacteroidetes bacterium]|nr:YfcE family phosphodiesterase [Bacteroidota bacterium]
MKSLVISDIHDNLHNLETALKIAGTSSCDSVICCGDLCSPFIIEEIHQKTRLPVHIVFGNNDGDRFTMLNKVNHANLTRKPDSQIFLHGEFLIKDRGQVLAGVPTGISIAVYHYPNLAVVLSKSGLFDFVFYGHSHKPGLETVNSCTLANPGSVMGYIPENGGTFTNPTCLIVNYSSKEIELIEF